MLGIWKKLIVFMLLATLSVNSTGTDETKDDGDKIANAYRLPKSVVPEAYDLKLFDIDFKRFTFNGSIKIDTLVANETNEIVLHKGNLSVSTVTVIDLQTRENLDIADKTYNSTTEKFSIFMKKNLKKSMKINVTLTYDGNLRDNMIGFYRSTYKNERNEDVWLAATQFESTHARHAFPCFDEPAFKAKFNVSILPPEGYSCLSNMPLKSNDTWWIFEESVPMSTYLVAFVISDFKSLSHPSDASFRLWSRSNALNQAKYGVEIGVKALAYLEKHFGHKYQLKKMDMVAVPDFSAGAMENWGLIAYRETASLYDENESPAISQQSVASVIVHECTHMWFGNLVTPEWWDYLWLSEAFARYYQYMATNEIEKSWKMDQQFVVEQHQTALGVDSLETTVPMTRKSNTQSEIGKMGGTITYNKGASIVRMMELTFGSKLFNEALQDYLEKRQYNSTTPDHLWKALQRQVDLAKDPKLNISVAKVMKTWTEQAGFPYINVKIEKDKISLSQERFWLRKVNDIPTDSTWWVPITWTSYSQNSAPKESTKPVYWLSERNSFVPYENKNNDLIIFNVHSVGFYRVLYDHDSWKRIINILTTGDFEKIHELNRAAIVDDLLNFARADLLDYKLALSGIQYLKKEKNYLPFKSALTAFDYLVRKFSGTTENDKIFKEYIISLLKNTHERLGFTDKPQDDRFTILLRQEINKMLCKVEYTDCIKESKKYFADWKNKQILVPKNQRLVVYCTAIKFGDDSDWEFLSEQYGNANVAHEQAIILNALGCSKNTTILEKYLLKALLSYEKSRIRKQDIASVFSGVYSSSVTGAEFMLKFIENHHSAIFNYHRNYDEIASLISGTLQKYQTKNLIASLENSIKSNTTHLKSIISSLNKTLNLANYEQGWFDKYSPIIIDWIKTNENKESASTTLTPPINSLTENTTDYRLPNNVIPSAYNIQLIPHIVPNKFTFDGEVTITAKVLNSTDKIILHSDQLIIHDDTVIVTKTNSPSDKLIVTNITRIEKYHFTNILLRAPIEANTEINIKIKYEGILNTEMRGFYRSSYRMNNQTRWLAATHLEPVAARRVFPCFDEPALKATFDVSVRVPKNYNAIGNTKVKSNDNGLWVFETTPIMSTYLVAIVVSDFVPKHNNDSERIYGVWANPLVTHQLSYSLEVMRSTVEFFERKLGIPYHLSKMDMIALPDFNSGAMENWGLLTYREANMLYDPEKMSSHASKQLIRNIIAHEIAHQWFGDLVSPLWWDYLWLSEGFARYFQYHAHTEAENSWKLETQFVVDHLQTSFSIDALASTHPISHKVYSPTEIRAIFDKISYAKAASVIRMLEKLTGSEIFYGALHRYLKKCEYSTGTPEALFAAFQEDIDAGKIVKFPVIEVMNSWTLQSGFPVINVVFDDNKATFTQSRFLLKSKTNESNKSIWRVPINYATRSNPNFNVTNNVTWLYDKPISIKINNADKDWIIVNLQQTGYYRVNYDESMWRRIVQALNTEHIKIHEVNRASLMDDLFNLAQTGLVSYDIVLSGTRYLAHEKEYGPWRAAANGFAYLNKRFAGRQEIYDSYRSYILELLEPSLKRLGFEEKPEESHVDKLLRKLVLEWLCNFEHESCVNEAVKLFEKSRNDEKFTIPPNQHGFVYCTAIRHGTTDDWTYLWNKFIKSDYAAEKINLINALACSKDSKNLFKLLNTAITSGTEIRFQDAKKVFTSVIKGGLVGIETTLNFIENNYEKIQNYFDNNGVIKNILNTISKRLSTDKLFDKFNSFVNGSSKTMQEIAKPVQSFLEHAKYELKRYEEQSPKIIQWLDTNNPRADYRLPIFAKPLVYDIHLKPYFEDRNFTFEGKVSIDVLVESSTKFIVLHANDLNIEKIYLPDASSHKIDFHTYNATTQKLKVYFKEELTANTTLQLKFDYIGHLRADMKGFYRSYYVDKTKNIRWIASTHFEPTFARRAFPCFDEPSFKANFTIHISKPKGYRTLSNMGSNPVEREDTDDRKWDDYPTSIKMSPYLVAFVVSDFIKVSANVSNVAAWARPDLKNYLNYAPVIGRKSLDFLEEFTSISYPLKEMNFVAVPDFDMGAMENWGLVTFREYGLTYDVSRISASYKRYVNIVIAHELVHMWFGDLVTCDWWDYTWLNEGFAEYLSYLVSNSTEPDWYLMKQFIVQDLHVALKHDSLEFSHPMNNKVLTPAEALDGFDKIAYQKSASVLRMLHHSFGNRVFVEALREYLKSRKYDTARPEHLIQAFQARLDEEPTKPGNLQVNATTVMRSWIEQSGYPVVNATRNGTTVILSQERFLISPSNSPSAKNRTYWIPITYTSQTNSDFKNTVPRLWLGEKKESIKLSPNDTWYILNIQEVGFYRVNYDKSNWHQLIKILNSDDFKKIEEINRAQLIDDSMNLARAGYIDYEIAFNISKYLIRETNYLPWKAFFDASAFLSQRIDGNLEIKQLYARHVLTLLPKAYQKLGFNENMLKDRHIDQLHRELILNYACKYGHEDCKSQSENYFVQDRITPNIASSVYCTVIENGNLGYWVKLWEKFLANDIAAEYLTMLKGIGCSRNPKMIERFFDIALMPKSPIRRQDIDRVFSSVYSANDVGLTVAFDYFENNLMKLREYYGNWHEVESIFSGLASYICTTEQLEKLEKLANDPKASEIKGALIAAVKSTKKNFEWFNKRSIEINSWLSDHYKAVNGASMPSVLFLTLCLTSLFIYFTAY